MKGDPALMQTSFVSLSEINKVEHIKEDIKEEKSVQDNGDLKEGMKVENIKEEIKVEDYIKGPLSIQGEITKVGNNVEIKQGLIE